MSAAGPTAIPPTFDVFLAYHSEDGDQVQAVWKSLKQRGLRPWLDRGQIPPGRWFQDIIRDAIPRVGSVAIFIGSNGLGRWELVELRAFKSVLTGIPVILVLLPGVKEVPDELPFLKQLAWVRFEESVDEKQALDALEWGITGVRPEGEDLFKKQLVELGLLSEARTHEVTAGTERTRIKTTGKPLSEGIIEDRR